MEPNGMETSHGQERIKDYLKLQFNLSGDQVETLIPDFINTLANHLDHLESVLAHGDLGQIGKAAHTIKGALMNLGLHECTEIAFAIEQKAKSGDLLANFSGLGRDLREKLNTYLR